jgi:predicted glycogen debranching enzyme
MTQVDLRLPLDRPAEAGAREWFVANGLGGYASGRLDGTNGRRHDGLLVAALPGLGRTILLDRVEESFGADADGLAAGLVEFRLEAGLPVWTFTLGDALIERRLVMPWRQNTTLITYRLLRGGPLTLSIRPWCHIRRNDWGADQPLLSPRLIGLGEGRTEIVQGDLPPLRLALCGESRRIILDDGRVRDAFYPVEAERDYTAHGPVWSPGRLEARLTPAAPVTLIASAEPWPAALAQDGDSALAAEGRRRQRLIACAHPALRDGVGARLVLAADAFVFEPVGRFDLAARAQAEGDAVASVVAGYPWFNDWGRDTMISLEGLTLLTGRIDAARAILLTFAAYERDGLIPNNIPDGGSEGVYHAADASLWFFHAVARTVAAGGDCDLLARLLPVLGRILAAHRAGTRFGIGIDPADGLLRQGAEGFMLTWMDSATPRRGKAVEINALWYNALKLMEGWLAEAGDGPGARGLALDAERARVSFNQRFWNPATGHLFDLVDGESGDDPALRCNQILSLSLDHPVLDAVRWPAVIDSVERHLLTPFGLRSLSPEAAEYRPAYAGDLHARDFAYHRGTVWAWLIGPFIDARLRLDPAAPERLRPLLAGLAGALDEDCLGTLAEVFDGDPPHRSRGCPAQAWSVAEMLRAWVRTAPAAWVFSETSGADRSGVPYTK